MADDLTAARLQMQELTERLHRLRNDLKITLDAIARAEADYYRLEGRLAALATRPLKKKKKGTPEKNSNPKRGKVAEAALQVIRAEGRPLSRAELFERLAAGGLRIEGANPLMVFSTMLWRERDKIARIKGHGYWPADRPYPAAGYFPSDIQPTLF